ncbi:MAG: TetR/AcrR family transcriptional regulator [Acidimicrobiia bacterium]
MTQTTNPPTTAPERMLEAAQLCFSRFGFQKTSMEDIAREAGVSRGSIYRHFPDKEALYRAVAADQARHYLGELRRRTARLPSLTDQLVEAAQLTVTFLQDNPLNAAMQRTDPDAFVRLLTTGSRDLVAMGVEAVIPLIEAAVERGEVRPDLDVRRAAEWMTRVVLSLIVTPAVTFDADDPAQRRSFIREFLVPGLS